MKTQEAATKDQHAAKQPHDYERHGTAIPEGSVAVTIDGQVHHVKPGTKSLPALMKECELDPGTKKLTLVGIPIPAYVMGLSDSYTFIGGESFSSQ